MEIGPIPGIRGIAAPQTAKASTQLSGVFDIENYARIGDETYTPSQSRSNSGQEDYADEWDDELDASAEPRDPEEIRIVSFFA